MSPRAEEQQLSTRVLGALQWSCQCWKRSARSWARPCGYVPWAWAWWFGLGFLAGVFLVWRERADVWRCQEMAVSPSRSSVACNREAAPCQKMAAPGGNGVQGAVCSAQCQMGGHFYLICLLITPSFTRCDKEKSGGKLCVDGMRLYFADPRGWPSHLEDCPRKSK